MKRILIFFTSLLLLLLLPKNTYATGEFITDIAVYYEVQSSGDAKVTHYVTLENAFTDVYATNYSFSLVGINPASVEGFEGNKKLATIVTKEGENTMITVAFSDAVVGRGAKRQFNIRYNDSSIITKTGEVWEAIIPKLNNANMFRDYRVSFQVPKTIGDVAYISPTPSEKTQVDSKTNFVFTKDQLVTSPITAAFGKFQVFSYDLVYHLENPLAKLAYTEIALPPDTQYQKVVLEKLDPHPAQTYLDQDGNWIAKYIMEPRERIDVRAIGSVQIFAEPTTSNPDPKVLSDALQPSPVWQVNDPKIQQLAKELKTPENIYNYVVKTLSYDYERVKPNVTRFGAYEALNNPKSAICMEFTDLFVAISRAAGIPTREINGFAYTENTQLQPLSLVADVLHSWAEYWDDSKKTWIQVDPTWGNTTGGADFFNKLDLRHFTFVIHGKDAYQPYPPGSYKLGPNPQKDVFVTFGQLPEIREGKLFLDLDYEKQAFFDKTSAHVTVRNVGLSSLSNQQVSVFYDDKKVSSYITKTLLPYGDEKIELEIPFSFLGFRMPNNITVVSGDQRIVFPTHRQQVIITHFAAVLFIFFALLLLTFMRLKRINGVKFWEFRKKVYAILPNFRKSTKATS